MLCINRYGLKCTKRTSIRATNRLISCKFIDPPPKHKLLLSKKNISLSGIFFSNLYVYTIVRDLKDVIFVTECGASYIPFVNTWINLPFSVGFLFLYNYLLNKYDFETSFFTIYFMLSVLYGFIGIVLYPIRDILFIPNVPLLLSNWVVTLYYVLSPIWGTIVVSVLFWSFANKYTAVSDAKDIYPFMGIIANVALIIAGIVMHMTGSFFATDWNVNVQVLTVINLIVSMTSLCIFKNFIKYNKPIRITQQVKKKVSLKVGVYEFLNNVFVRNMIIMVSSYGLLIGFYESIWKYYLKMYFDSPIFYSKFMAMISIVTGIFTIILMSIISFCFRKWSWTRIALITPISMCIMGVLFFGSIQTKSVSFISISGAILTIFLKGAKYAIFDPCKEIAYIPMNEEIKTRGKATIEILSSPIGKSGSNWILQFLMLSMGSIELSATIIGLLYMITSIYWILSTIDMGDVINEYSKKKKKHE